MVFYRFWRYNTLVEACSVTVDGLHKADDLLIVLDHKDPRADAIKLLPLKIGQLITNNIKLGIHIIYETKT